VWGGANEQEAEHVVGNQHVKNWQDKACKILEKMVYNFPLNLSTCSLWCSNRLNSTGRHAQMLQAGAINPLLPLQQKRKIQLLSNLIDITSPLSLKNKKKDGRLKFTSTSKTCPPMSQKILMLLHGGRYVLDAVTLLMVLHGSCLFSLLIRTFWIMDLFSQPFNTLP
jgi:hypothetical protein